MKPKNIGDSSQYWINCFWIFCVFSFQRVLWWRRSSSFLPSRRWGHWFQRQWCLTHLSVAILMVASRSAAVRCTEWWIWASCTTQSGVGHHSGIILSLLPGSSAPLLAQVFATWIIALLYHSFSFLFPPFFFFLFTIRVEKLLLHNIRRRYMFTWTHANFKIILIQCLTSSASG